MLVSDWKENFEGFGVWTATNCATEGPHAPKIVESSSGTFGTFGVFGESLNMGESFKSFETAAEFLESVLTWTVMLNGHSLTLTGDSVVKVEEGVT